MRGKRLENGADVDEVGEPLLSPRIPDVVRPPPQPGPLPRAPKEKSPLT